MKPLLMLCLLALCYTAARALDEDARTTLSAVGLFALTLTAWHLTGRLFRLVAQALHGGQ